MKMWRS